MKMIIIEIKVEKETGSISTSKIIFTPDTKEEHILRSVQEETKQLLQ